MSFGGLQGLCTFLAWFPISLAKGKQQSFQDRLRLLKPGSWQCSLR